MMARSINTRAETINANKHATRLENAYKNVVGKVGN